MDSTKITGIIKKKKLPTESVASHSVLKKKKIALNFLKSTIQSWFISKSQKIFQ